MNLPNKLTLLRVCLIPFFVVFARMGALWAQCVAVGIYALACATDALDGHIARSRNLITDFGKFMDPIADKLLVMSALIVLTAQGRMADWACILMLAREFLVSGFRLVAVENGRVIAAGPLGKLKTVFQMAATIALMLFVPVEGEPLLGQAGVTIANVLLYVAVALTVVSGADYIIRNRDCIRNM
ncbi:MAG: CDP-diacylglycerol--glycerol-3-phosphate 3-phosphatidyltransferase [Clostridia bacterium]|nr:CDP-diacylglycerol--glycerol-3-phosphate 3-phosphatidyltransferase [Clostridia bacterium]